MYNFNIKVLSVLLNLKDVIIWWF